MKFILSFALLGSLAISLVLSENGDAFINNLKTELAKAGVGPEDAQATAQEIFKLKESGKLNEVLENVLANADVETIKKALEAAGGTEQDEEVTNFLVQLQQNGEIPDVFDEALATTDAEATSDIEEVITPGCEKPAKKAKRYVKKHYNKEYVYIVKSCEMPQKKKWKIEMEFLNLSRTVRGVMHLIIEKRMFSYKVEPTNDEERQVMEECAKPARQAKRHAEKYFYQGYTYTVNSCKEVDAGKKWKIGIRICGGICEDPSQTPLENDVVHVVVVKKDKAEGMLKKVQDMFGYTGYKVKEPTDDGDLSDRFDHKTISDLKEKRKAVDMDTLRHKINKPSMYVGILLVAAGIPLSVFPPTSPVGLILLGIGSCVLSGSGANYLVPKGLKGTK